MKLSEIIPTIKAVTVAIQAAVAGKIAAIIKENSDLKAEIVVLQAQIADLQSQITDPDVPQAVVDALIEAQANADALNA